MLPAYDGILTTVARAETPRRASVFPVQRTPGGFGFRNKASGDGPGRGSSDQVGHERIGKYKFAVSIEIHLIVSSSPPPTFASRASGAILYLLPQHDPLRIQYNHVRCHRRNRGCSLLPEPFEGSRAWLSLSSHTPTPPSRKLITDYRL